MISLMKPLLNQEGCDLMKPILNEMICFDETFTESRRLLI